MRIAERYRIWVAGGVVVLVVVLVAAVSVALRGLPTLPWAEAAPRVTTTATPPSPTAEADGGSGSTAEAPVAPASARVGVDGAAASSPDAAAVVDVLTRHFTAINERDYSRWTTTVTDRRAAKQPPDRWAEDFSTTNDSGVVVSDITPTSTGVAATLTFVSTQDLAHAPAAAPYTCLRWSSRWPLEGSGADLRIGTPPKGTTAPPTPC